MKQKLPYLCEIQYGYPFDSKLFNESEGTPLIRIRDVKRGYSETYTTEEVPEGYLITEGNMLIGMDGEFKIAKWGNIPSALNQRVCRIIPKDNIYADYIYYALPMQLKAIEDRTSFATVKHLSARVISNIEIEVPCIEQQIKIAEILNKIVAVIQNRRQQLEELNTLTKAKFVEMFGDPVRNPLEWKKCCLDDCLESIDNGRSFVCDNSSRAKNEPAILKLSAVTYGIYKPTENKTILDENDFVGSSEVHSGDLLFTRKNTPELVGMSAYVSTTPEKLMMPDLIFRLNTKKNCHKIFLWQLINHDLFRGQIQNLASGSAKSMSNISKEKLRKLVIALPPIELQEHFAIFITQVNKSKVAIQKSLDETQLLFDSLMQKYFG